MKHSYKMRKLRNVLFIGAIVTAMASCATPEKYDSLSKGMAKVDLRVSATPSPNEVYEARNAFTVPKTHKVGDKIFPYEGVGWENEIVGYRLYLDERAVTDIFGKRTSDIVLDKVDYRSKYHDLADWGMDVMKVGPSLGVGGLGLYRGDSLERFGADGEISIKVLEESGAQASFKVTHSDVPLGNGAVGNVATTYTLKSGSPLTWVSVNSNLPTATLASGLVKSPKNKRMRNSDTVKKGEWRYIATWGDDQSEAKDGLGTILFYRDGDARLMPSVNDTFPIRFNTSNPTYAFAGVWEQGPMGISNKESFIAWADEQQRKLNK
jgi:hypothetical protein